MRVLISGYLGLGNLGDEALFAGLADGLRRFGHEPLALSADPGATRRLHGVEAHHRLLGLPRALTRCDALVSGGGGLLQDVTSRRSLRYYLTVIRLARTAGRRTVVFGQSIGPLSDRGRTAVARSLRGLPIGGRDEPSRLLLAERDLPSTLVADPALLLPDRSEPRDADADETADARPGEVLLIPRADVAGQREALQAVAAWARSQGRPVTLAALQSGPDGDEADAIAAATPAAQRATWNDPFQVAARCGGASLVVSVRLHGLIFAARAGVAHVGVGYDPKVAGFAERSGAAVVPVPVDPQALLAAAKAAEPPTPARTQALRRHAEAGLAWLDAALRDEPHIVRP
ncbi:MAG: polysaccharide pyruvyl transferase CsaB [Trueperaceae bacterium]